MSAAYKISVGRRGEELAAQYLEANGFTVTARNFRIYPDEIDIIAQNEKYIVFAEVKTRAQTKANLKYGRPAAAVNYNKQKKLLRAATEYLRREKPEKQPRIDVIEVYFPPVHEGTPCDIGKLLPLKIKHITNAVHK